MRKLDKCNCSTCVHHKFVEQEATDDTKRIHLFTSTCTLSPSNEIDAYPTDWCEHWESPFGGLLDDLHYIDVDALVLEKMKEYGTKKREANGFISSGIPLINMGLAESRGLTEEQIAEVTFRQNKRHIIELEMAILDVSDEADRKKLEHLYAVWVENEYLLQDAWGFERNSNMHRDYLVPHCSCPKMDNDDMYGTDLRYRSPNCIFHGN